MMEKENHDGSPDQANPPDGVKGDDAHISNSMLEQARRKLPETIARFESAFRDIASLLTR